MFALFKDRKDAGHQLGLALVGHYGQRDDVLVLGLARGGVPVAHEVAALLDAPLDVMLVRKLGLPQHKEYAMGAIASGGIVVLDNEVMRTMGISRQALDNVMEAEQKELSRREKSYRPRGAARKIEGQTVILVDDGLATGSTMRAAIASVRGSGALKVVVAVPVAAGETCEMIRKEVDDAVCLGTPAMFRAVGLWYEDFPQVSDDEVRASLA